MNTGAEQFPFVARDPTLGAASLAPMLPLTLVTSATVVTSGLLDTGAAVNVLPYEIGMKLGLNWDGQTTPIRLTGNLASVEARGHHRVRLNCKLFARALGFCLGER